MERRHLEDLFRRSGAALALTDPEGRVLAASPALCRLLGRSQDELLGRRLSDLRHPDEPELVVNDREAIPPVEKRYLRPDGSVVWALTTGALIRDADGAPQHIVRHLADVTARKEAERLARTRAAQQAAVVGLGRAALRDVDVDDLFERAVAVVVEHLPADRAVVIQARPEEPKGAIRAWAGTPMVDGDVGPVAVGEHIKRVLRSPGGVVSGHLTAEKRFSGDARLTAAGFQSVVGVPIRSGSRPWGMLGGASMVEATYSEDDRIFLEAVADVLGAAITRRRLGEVERAAEVQSRVAAVGALAAGLAHDLGTSVAVVKAHTELLRRTIAPSPDALRQMEMLEQGCDRTVELVSRLLDLARARDLRLEPVDLGHHVSQLADVVAAIVPPAIELRCEVAPGELVALADRRAVDHIVLNLVTNAADAMPDGGAIVVSVRFERETHGVVIEVADTGPGMTPEVQARAFDPFFTTKPHEGTGLGLPRVRALVEQHGGRVVLQTTPGAGTTVCTWLPAVPDEEKQQPQAPGGQGGF